jgi:LysM repeat protein
MNLPFRPKKKKLMAATARRPREADFTEEPNVKLSSAFIVVLVLHIVAVGGIYAFNALKAHQAPAFEDTETPPQVQNASTVQADAPATPAPSVAGPTWYRVKSGDTIAKIAAAFGVVTEDLIKMNDLRAQGGIHVGENLQIPAGGIAPVAATDSETTSPAPLRDSGTTYTVVRGDTPERIAHKLHVAYDDLIRLNKIEDPKKLKIGLKLRVPARRSTAENGAHKHATVPVAVPLQSLASDGKGAFDHGTT